MEIEGQDGSKLQLDTNSDTVFGRGLGFNTKDNTVSRRHVIFNLNEDPETETFSRVSFQVTGKNPIWIRRRGGGEEIEIFRNSESGQVEDGDRFCVSSQNPVWFCVKSVNLETFDVSKIDPVKEFGFLVIGHEFDGYSKHKIGGVKNWNWFLEDESRSDGDDDEDGGEKKRRKRKKTGRGGTKEDDEDWSGESEEDKEIVLKKEVGVRPKYLTRSKEASKVRKDMKTKKSAPKEEVEEQEEDEEDETLGGFIVGDENEVEEEELDETEEEEEDEEEEEFVDDDDDD